MKPSELDVVRLTDGREVTILEVFDNGEAFMVETSAEPYAETDIFVVPVSSIKTILWRKKLTM